MRRKLLNKWIFVDHCKSLIEKAKDSDNVGSVRYKKFNFIVKNVLDTVKLGMWNLMAGIIT